MVQTLRILYSTRVNTAILSRSKRARMAAWARRRRGGGGLEKGVVALAEENYDNGPWQDPKAFARQIQLFEVSGRYTLLDVAPNASRNPEGGRIAGWIYPLTDE